MAKIAFILLCHKDPDGVIAQVRALRAGGDRVVVHYDARAPAAEFRQLDAALRGMADVVVLRRRMRCGWGDWSLVAASLAGLRAGLAAFEDASHFYLLSGDCVPIKTAEHAHALLDATDADHIESVDFLTSGWIRTGLREERLIYRHIFNERRQRRLFYATLALQRALRLRRRTPPGLRIMIGSQWWCLRRATVAALLAFCARTPAVPRFFRHSWIPDETFFQTLVHHLVPDSQITGKPLTFLLFTDYGMPVTFHADHRDLLLGQPGLFARKISAFATPLRAELLALYAEQGRRFDISREGAALYAFLAGRGRIGGRFGRRAWERSAALGPDRELLIVICKKWHVAKRLVARAAPVAGLPALDYPFDEEACPMPDLGGIETGLAKRGRHRRALLGLLFERLGARRLMLCVDPSNFDLLQDLCAEGMHSRLLMVTCDHCDAYLAGHARRAGLLGEASHPTTLRELLPALRQELEGEALRIRKAGLAPLWLLEEAAPASENAPALAEFLSVAHDEAEEILQLSHLFSD